MNMMNKCAKFHKADSPSGKKVKFNFPSAIELSETCWFCVQLCIETLRKHATSVAHLTNFSFEFFMKFSQKMPLYFFYHGAKSQKWPKTQIKGSCLEKFWKLGAKFRKSQRKIRYPFTATKLRNNGNFAPHGRKRAWLSNGTSRHFHKAYKISFPSGSLVNITEKILTKKIGYR